MFTEKIKEATLELHQQVEKLLVIRMKSMRSRQDYTDLLQIFYSYFGGLEQKIKPYINDVNLPDYNERRKTEAIKNDLNILGSSIPPVANDEELPQINNELQAFGAMYVIEGSTLGGKIISRIIQQHLNLDNGAGLSFFNGYGEHTPQMWETFKEVLNHHVKSEADEFTVFAAANETFGKFKFWIEKAATSSS